jgi:hypothetical protein
MAFWVSVIDCGNLGSVCYLVLGIWVDPFSVQQPAFDSRAVLLKKLFNDLHTPLGMTPGPEDAFAFAAPVKFVVGFPDVIGHQAADDLFVDFNDRGITLEAD